MKIGTDIVEICRFLEKINDEKFVNRFFSKREIEHIFEYKNPKKQAERMAGKFAGKEAVLKAFGVGISNDISLFEIEILPNNLQAPTVELSGKSKEIFDKMQESRIEISISHTDKIAQSTCIIF